MPQEEKMKDNIETEKAQEAPILDEASGNALMEKILNVFKNADIPSVDASILEDKEKEYTEKYARLQAEFDNYRKRTEKERQENLANANANLISDLLPTLDHFELALKHNKDKGVMMIYEELNNILAKQGLTVIDTKGTFNPKIHEAVLTTPGDEDGIIVEEIQKGFLLNDKLLRASKVKISKKEDKKWTKLLELI